MSDREVAVAKPDPSFLLNTTDKFISKGRNMSKFTLKWFEISH